MPENVSIERRQLLEIFGAEITLSPGEEGSNGAIRLAEKIAADEPELRVPLPVRQPREPARALRGHRPRDPRATARRSTCSSPALGTSGTLMGVGKYLKQRQARTCRSSRSSHPRVSSCRACATSTTASSRRSSMPACSTARLIVRPRESVEWTRRLLDECGVFAGISSGAAMAGAAHEQPSRWTSGTIVVLLPDGGWKYLSSRRVDRPDSTRSSSAPLASTTGDPLSTDVAAPSTRCAPASSSRSRPRRSTASVPTPRTPRPCARLYEVKGRPRRPSR